MIVQIIATTKKYIKVAEKVNSLTKTMPVGNKVYIVDGEVVIVKVYGKFDKPTDKEQTPYLKRIIVVPFPEAWCVPCSLPRTQVAFVPDYRYDSVSREGNFITTDLPVPYGLYPADKRNFQNGYTREGISEESGAYVGYPVYDPKILEEKGKESYKFWAGLHEGLLTTLYHSLFPFTDYEKGFYSQYIKGMRAGWWGPDGTPVAWNSQTVFAKYPQKVDGVDRALTDPFPARHRRHQYFMNRDDHKHTMCVMVGGKIHQVPGLEGTDAFIQAACYYDYEAMVNGEPKTIRVLRTLIAYGTEIPMTGYIVWQYFIQDQSITPEYPVGSGYMLSTPQLFNMHVSWSGFDRTGSVLYRAKYGDTYIYNGIPTKIQDNEKLVRVQINKVTTPYPQLSLSVVESEVTPPWMATTSESNPEWERFREVEDTVEQVDSEPSFSYQTFTITHKYYLATIVDGQTVLDEIENRTSSSEVTHLTQTDTSYTLGGHILERLTVVSGKVISMWFDKTNTLQAAWEKRTEAIEKYTTVTGSGNAQVKHEYDVSNYGRDVEGWIFGYDKEDLLGVPYVARSYTNSYSTRSDSQTTTRDFKIEFETSTGKKWTVFEDDVQWTSLTINDTQQTVDNHITRDYVQTTYDKKFEVVARYDYDHNEEFLAWDVSSFTRSLEKVGIRDLDQTVTTYRAYPTHGELGRPPAYAWYTLAVGNFNPEVIAETVSNLTELDVRKAGFGDNGTLFIDYEHTAGDTADTQQERQVHMDMMDAMGVTPSVTPPLSPYEVFPNPLPIRGPAFVPIHLEQHIFALGRDYIYFFTGDVLKLPSVPPLRPADGGNPRKGYYKTDALGGTLQPELDISMGQAAFTGDTYEMSYLVSRHELTMKYPMNGY
jgi:hypothetical protein